MSTIYKIYGIYQSDQCNVLRINMVDHRVEILKLNKNKYTHLVLIPLIHSFFNKITAGEKLRRPRRSLSTEPNMIGTVREVKCCGFGNDVLFCSLLKKRRAFFYLRDAQFIFLLLARSLLIPVSSPPYRSVSPVRTCLI